MQLIDQKISLHDTDNGLVIERSQYIDPTYLATLRAQRDASMSTREGEFMRVCSVPVALAEKWLAKGFDVYRESAKAIVARLKAENCEAFLTTNKQV